MRETYALGVLPINPQESFLVHDQREPKSAFVLAQKQRMPYARNMNH